MDTNAGTDPVLVGALEAAEILGLERGHVNRLAAAGTLKTHVKLPGLTGARLFTVAELERFKAENFRPATAPAYDDVTA